MLFRSRGTLLSGAIKAGDKVTAVVDKNRQASMKNHTATHLLQWALRQTLGESVKQQGSLVCPDYLRFDFTWPKSLSKEQARQIETLVQDKIDADIPVTTTVLPIDQAKGLGATALFGEKYGDHVRVIGIGADSRDTLHDAFSKEFCGGTHVSSTGQIGGFCIIKEESVAAGVRRITALTGPGLMRHLAGRMQIVDELVETLKSPAEQVVEIGRASWRERV